MSQKVSSRISGFYKRCLEDRLRAIEALGLLDEDARAHLAGGGGLPTAVADRMCENVIATHALPLGLALNFRVNQRDVLVPMAVEEPSVIAAASNAARMVRLSGGFSGEADPPVMTAQVQLDDVPDAEAAAGRLAAAREHLLAAGDAAIPRMVARGGGCRDVEVRVLSAELGVLVVHLYIDVGDAMGANLVDTVAEAVAPLVQRIAGGTLGLRILTNLTVRRLVRVTAAVGDDALGGADVASGIARASRFAELDPYRAATHNKGFMNGLDAAAVALGQDFRAIEAGAHAYAAMSGRYGPLSTWERVPGGLVGRAELPLAVGTVGGSTQVHAGVRAALQLVGATSARELAVVLASVGLASNLAALRALAGEGIQRGHMRLHERKRALAAAAPASADGGGPPSGEGKRIAPERGEGPRAVQQAEGGT
ncbi:3-hydroxy-3-methylglutaryl-CoA reductase [Sorangium cellulosum]|uniref:3-hydroxy-3-methylglutaryl coenzyme A reductase n=1 Tax=Sorangium cellulosum TaxID=56 RepID=A0A2L0ERT1_SORCE|nr:hydroxymethylglutaryl-CoA reductase, degradative [Sorangium cellulosum]AUX42028.1 3-hydroxy-3-methylglutaryl-CoA reductase [Sorangium cellulosum]